MAIDVERSSTGVLTGEELLRDFRTSIEIASSIADFESWLITGNTREELVSQIQNNPVAAEKRIAVGGLETLLSSDDEKTEIGELVEKYKGLELKRFIGANATVTAAERGPIVGYEIANRHFMFWDGSRYLETSYKRKHKTANITSFNPAKGAINIGENRRSKWNWTIIGGGFWAVYPFDKETGEPVVTIDIAPQD